MIPVAIHADMEALRQSLIAYGKISGKSEAEVIWKQGAKLAFNLRTGLKALMPAKGSIREEMIASLHSGGGIKIRPFIYEKLQGMRGISQDIGSGGYRFGKQASGSVTRGGNKLNYQALAVKAELGLRESGRGFMAWSAPRSRSYAEEQSVKVQSDRYGRLLSFLKMDLNPDAPVKLAQFSWPSQSPALAGLSAAQQMAAVDEAVRVTTADINVYIEKKLQEDKAQAGL